VQEMQVAGNGVDTWTGGVTGFAFGLLFFNNFSYFFGYLGGQPQLTTRFMALRNKKEAKTASITGIVWTLIAFFGAFFIGLTAMDNRYINIWYSRGNDNDSNITNHGRYQLY